MEHKSAHELRTIAQISTHPPHPPTQLGRRERLLRWADLLDQEPDRRINLVRELEFAAQSAQADMRADESALSIAYADPLFRSLGLKSDRVGDGCDFFSLNDSQTHRLLCSCMHGMSMKAGDAARIVRNIANPLPGTITRSMIAAAICAAPVAMYYFG